MQIFFKGIDLLNQQSNVSHESLAQNSDINYYVIVYGFSMLLVFVSGLFKAMVFVKVSLNASTNLHNRMLRSVLRAETVFFDTTPSGRILNRFSKDLDESEFFFGIFFNIKSFF